MIISMKVNELIDGKIEFLSLVKNAANRSPWKIIKAEEPVRGLWDGLLPEFDKLEKMLTKSESVTKETKTMNITKNDESKAQAAAINRQDIAKLRHRLSGLYNQQQNLWERPTTPAFQKFDDELTFCIEKTESELRVLVSDEEQMVQSSAFFFRGGTSSSSQATLSDSAFDQRSAAVRKAENEIDLSPIVTTTDEAEVAKIDLSGLIF